MTSPRENADSTDVVDILTADHHDLLELVVSIPGLDEDRRRDVVDTVIAELVRHSVAEEMYVYPAMRRHLDGGDESVAHDVEEHQHLEETMKALEGVPAGDERFLGLVGQLEEQLRHHASDEEEEQFPKLRAALSEDDLVHLGAKVRLAKDIAPTRPHPGSPHAALFHKTLGPGVGFVDKVRDAVSGRIRNT